jgi:hypothetical protein
MIGRRRFTRYVLPAPADGHARTVSDCVVESWNGESGIVVTGQPAQRDDALMLQFNSSGGATRLYPVRVVSCEMDPRHGPLRFKLHVQAAADTNQPGASVDLRSRTQPGPVKR